MPADPSTDLLLDDGSQQSHAEQAEGLFRDLLGTASERLRREDRQNPLALTETTRFYDNQGRAADNLIGTAH